MPHLAIIVDADACVPQRLRADLGMLTAPLDAPELDASTPVGELRREAGPNDPAAVTEARLRAAADHDAVLYFSAGPGPGAAPGAAEAPGERARFEHVETGSALMAAGWQAVAAAVAARHGGGVEEASAAARTVGASVSTLLMLEHPEFAAAGGPMAGLRRRRAVVRLEGSALDVLERCARRDQALVALRDRFAAEAAGEGRLRVAVHHAAAAAAAEAMAQWVRATMAPEEVVIAPLTRHAASWWGPGMVGFAWYRER